MNFIYEKLLFTQARTFCKMNPLNPLRFNLSQEKLRQTKHLHYSHLSNKRGGWNKRGGGAKVAKSLNVEVGINVEGGKI